MIRIFALICGIVAGLLHASSVTATEKSWATYDLPDYGISVALPVQPNLAIKPGPEGDGQFAMYQALDKTSVRQYTIFVGQPEQRGIFEPASMDAFLDNHLKSVVAATSGTIMASKRTTFLGMPALEYSYKHHIEDIPMVAKGVTFMIDGGHVRLSMWYQLADSKGPALYERLKKSFKLLPLAFRPSASPITDPRGVAFTPPLGWVKKEPQNPYEIARFSNLTRSMVLRAAGSRSYNCDAYRTELQRTGTVTRHSVVIIRGRQSQKIITFEDVPKYNVRLTAAHYCFDSKIGAVVLSGGEEQSMFWRWEAVIEGAASTVQVPVP